MNRRLLWLLVWTNGLGTIYGYYWYGNQIVHTIRTMPDLFVLFVPDSPTASLFFTLALLYMLHRRKSGKPGRIRSFVEAMAVITSFKYGVWAVVMIFAGAYRGDVPNWQDGC